MLIRFFLIDKNYRNNGIDGWFKVKTINIFLFKHIFQVFKNTCFMFETGIFYFKSSNFKTFNTLFLVKGYRRD